MSEHERPTLLEQAQRHATVAAEWDAQTRTTQVRGSLAARWKRLTARITAAWSAKPGRDDATVSGEVIIK